MEGISQEQASLYKQENQKLVLGQIIPAYQQLAQGISSLKGTGKNTGGLCGLPGGKEYYEYLVARTTGSSLSVTEMQKQADRQREQDLKDLEGIVEKNPSISQKCVAYQLPTEDASDRKSVV